MSKKQEFTIIKYSHLTKLYFSANGFKSTFENLKKQSVENLGIIQYENITPVTATNGLFALELYLKLIYSFDYWEKTQRCNESPLNETQYPKGHELLELFNKLELISKHAIYNGTLSELSNNDVDDFFQNCSNDFARWRYYFEGSGCMEGDFYSLTIILNTVSDFCTTYINHRMYTPEEWIESDTSTSVTMHKAKVSSLGELNNLQSKKLEDLI